MNEINDKYDHVGEFYQGVAIVVKDNLYGAVLMGGYEIVPPTYDYITSFKDGYAQAIHKGEYKILNLSGKECVKYNDGYIPIPSKYDYVRDFSGGYACVRLGDKWGAIDTEGNEIFAPQFYYLSDFVGGVAKFKKENDSVCNSWGYVHVSGFRSESNMYEPIIEEDGNIVVKKHICAGEREFRFKDRVLTDYIYSKEETVRINYKGQLVVKNGNVNVTLPDRFILARDFSCGLARVLDSTGYWGYVNPDGKIIIPLEYTEVQGFYENRAFVRDKNDKWCLISTNGYIIKTFDDLRFPYPFEKGYSVAWTNDDKRVLLDHSGSEVSQHFDGWISHTDYSDHFKITKDGLEGFYNVSTKLYIEPRFEKILEVHNDYVKIEVENIGEVFADFTGRAFIDGTPRIYLPEWCLGAKSLTDEVYLGISKDKKYGLIDSKGETICDPVIESILEVDGDIVVIERFCKKDSFIFSYGTFKYGLYDIKRKILIPADYDTRPELKDGYYLISKKDLFGILDLDGQQILKPEWKSITPVDDCFLVSKTNKQFGLVSKNGNVIIKPEYNEIVVLCPGIYKAKSGDRSAVWKEIWWEIYDENGELNAGPFDEVSLDGDTFIVRYGGRDGRLDKRGKKIVLPEDGTYVELPSKFRWGSDFKDGVAKVDVFPKVKYQNYVDASFNIVINDNDSIVTVDEGVDYIYERNSYGVYTYVSGDKYGLLSPEGKILVKAGYYNIRTISEDLYIASVKDGFNMKSGVIDVNGNVCIQPGYEDIQKTEYGYILKKGNKYGYAALDYSIICEPKYASIEELGNGFKRVSVDIPYGYPSRFRYGIIDQCGKECLEPVYISIGDMNEDGEAEIIAEHTKYGTVDSNYNIIKEPCEREVQLSPSVVIGMSKYGPNILKHEPAAEGLVWIHEKDTEKIGLATEDGKILIEPKFGKVEAFVNGYAKVNTGYWYKDEEYDEDDYPHWKVIRRYVDGKWGIIDTSGQTVLPPVYSLIQIDEDDTFKIYKDGHVGRLNKDGELIVKSVTGDYIPALPKYEWQSDFDTGGYSEVYYKGKIGVVNDKFQLIIPSDEFGTENDILIPEEYDWWTEYVNGLIVVVDKEGMSGIITTEGEIVVDPVYERIKVYRKDDKVFFLCDSTILDVDGNILAGSSYTDITLLNDNFFVAKTEHNKYAILDYNGQLTTEEVFDAVPDFDISTTIPPRNYFDKPQKIENQKYAIVNAGGLYGLIDRQGRLVVVPKYKSITIHENGCFCGNGVLYDVNERRVIVNGDSVIFVPDDYVDAQLLDNGLILVSCINQIGCKMWGCVNQNDTLVIPPLYHTLSYSEGLFLASLCEDDDYLERNRKLGVLNFRDEIILPFSDEYAEIKITDDLILCKAKYHSNLWGAYTREGINICEPIYKEIVPISQFAIKVYKETGEDYHGRIYKWGVIDFAGKEMLPFEYDWIANESINGLWSIRQGKRYGFIDVIGNLVLEPQYYSISDFQRGYAIVSLRGYDYNDWDSYRDAPREYPIYGVIDSQFNEVIPCVFRKLEHVEESNLFETEKGYKDPLGRYVAEVDGKKIYVPSKYLYCGAFKNGFAITILKTRYGKRYGLINDKPVDILPPIFESLTLLDNGLYKFKSNDRYGLVDNTGRIILPNKYNAIGKFVDNLACARVDVKSADSNKETNLYGYIDLHGNEVLPVEYEFIGKRFNNRSVVMKGGKWWLFGIDDHKLTAFPGVAHLGPCVSDDMCKINLGGIYDKENNRVKGGLWGYCSVDGKTVIEAVYESACGFSEGFAAVKKDGKWGFINTSGKIVIPCKFDKVDSTYKGGTCRLIKGEEVSVFDSNGNLTDRYTKEEDDYYETYDDDTPSIYDNPYYNDNIDMDQQSIEFWNNL